MSTNGQQQGTKLDDGKLDYSLEDPSAVAEKVAVLTYGAAKYDRGNYAFVADPHHRYYAALRRHLAAWLIGEDTDPETDLHHLAHAACCLEFLLALELRTPGVRMLDATRGKRLAKALEVAREIKATRLQDAPGRAVEST